MHAHYTRTLSRILATCALAACAVLSSSLSAQIGIGVTIGQPPPPMPYYEPQPPMPGDGYSWVDGYWGVNQGRYVWFPGRWERPPYAGAYWSHPHYDHYEDGWRMHPGHWDHEDHGEHRGRDHGHEDH